jgi:hypothetical protein
MQLIARITTEDDGVLTFEWVLMVTIIVIGIVSGIAASRDAIIDEMGDVAGAMLSLDQSYRIDYAPDVTIHIPPAFMGGSDSQFTDAAEFDTCDRSENVPGQGSVIDDPAP